MAATVNSTKQKKALFLAKYASTLGNVSEACKHAAISRGTYYNWIGKGANPALDIAFLAALDETDEGRTDYVEGQALQAMTGYEIEESRTVLVDHKETKEIRGKIVIVESKVPVIVKVKKQVKKDGGLIKHYLNAKARERGYGKELENKQAAQVTIKTIVIREAQGPTFAAAAEY